MAERENLRSRLQGHHLSFVWLVNMMRYKGYEIDKTTVCSAVNGSITGPRVEKINTMGHEIVDEYEKIWLGHIKEG